MKRLSVLILLLGVTFAQEDQWANKREDLSLLVPASTMAVVQFNDLGGMARWMEDSALGRIWAEPEMQKFALGLESMVNGAVNNAKGGFDPLAMIGLQHSDLEGIEIREIGLALVDFSFEGGQPKLDLVLTARFRAGADKGTRVIHAIRDGLQTFVGVVFEEIEMPQPTWKATFGNGMEVLYSVYGDRFFLTTGAERMSLVMAALDAGRHQPLYEAASYKRVVERLGADRHAALGYLNVSRVFERAMEIEEMQRGGASPSRQQWQALGLDALDAVAFADVPVGTGYRTECAITFEERRGLLTLLPQGQVSHRFLAQVPGNALAYGAANFDVNAWLDTLAGVVEGLEPKMVESAHKALAKAGERIGVDIRKDLIASLGDDWAWYVSVPPQGGLIPDVAVFVSAKDGERFENAVMKIVGKLRERAVKRGAYVELNETDFRGQRIRFVEAADRHGEPVPVQPCWVRGADYFVLGLYPQAVKHALMDKPSLDESEEFAALRRKIPDSSLACTYVDTTLLVRWGYNTFVPVLQGMQGAINAQLRPFQVKMNFQDLPPVEVITRHLSPMVLFEAGEADCYRVGFVSPYGSTGLVFPVAVAAGFGSYVAMRHQVSEIRVIEEAMPERDHARANAQRAALETELVRARAELAKSKRDNAALNQRLAQIEAQLAELRKLIDEVDEK